MLRPSRNRKEKKVVCTGGEEVRIHSCRSRETALCCLCNPSFLSQFITLFLEKNASIWLKLDPVLFYFVVVKKSFLSSLVEYVHV